MKLNGNTVLITGGATGIGYALAKAFLKRGNRVIICGRRKDRLEQAKRQLPELITRVSDVTNANERQALFHWATSGYEGLNVLVNNAGVQRDIDFTQGLESLESGESEIEVNLTAPVSLCALFIPFLMSRKDAAVINVSSGLAFVPERASRMPVYCATKAGLHAFCLSLRTQIKGSGVEVIEAIPPAVISELNIESRRKRGAEFRGMSADDYAAYVFEKLAQGQTEIRPPA